MTPDTLVDLEGERAILGCALLEPEAALPALGDLDPETYHGQGHRDLATALLGLYRAGAGVDPGTVRAELERMGVWDLDWPARLAVLQEAGTVPSLLPQYLATLKDRATRRGLRRVAREAVARASDLTVPLDSLLAGHLTAITALESGVVSLGIVEPPAVAAEMRAMTELPRLTTGLAIYDAEGGLTLGDLHVLAARTRNGKTVAGLQVVHHVGVTLGLPALFLSLEMARHQILLRLRNLAHPAEIEGSGVHIIDPVGMTAPEVASVLRRAATRHAIQVAVVDHLQQIQADPSKSWRREDQEIRNICQHLADTARALNIVVLALAQINREGAAKGNSPKPSLETVQGGGAIEQLSASVTMLYTDPPGTEDSDDPAIQSAFSHRKNRHGPSRTWRATFLRPHRFEGVG